MTDRLFDLTDPGHPALHPDYAFWLVEVSEQVRHERGPLGSADRLVTLVEIALTSWGVRDVSGDYAIVWLDPVEQDNPRFDLFDYIFTGRVVARTVAEANEELRRLVWRAIEATEADWERLERTKDADLRHWRPPVLPSP